VVGLHRRGSNIAVSYESNGRTKETLATQVICAMPFSILRSVDGIDALGLSPQKLNAIKTLGYGSNSKIMLEFSGKPWRQDHARSKAYSGLVYGDFKSQSFWETTRGQRGSHGILTNYMGGNAGMAVSQETVQKVALPDLEILRPGISKSFVKAAAHNWNNVPLALGSYSCLLAGQYGQMNGAPGEPELNGQLLFAGEHASYEFTSYMNGAFETGITAAKQVIKSRGATKVMGLASTTDE
jgi:monoamine oxidase